MEASYFGQKNPDILPYSPYSYSPTASVYGNNPEEIQGMYSVLKQSIPVTEASYGKRRMMKWLVPERGIVDMYINPQSLQITHNKKINPERTKGGFVVQYWGEELIEISISGTTGSSGIEGINVLYDIYRAEQVAFDVIALEEAKKQLEEEFDLAGIVQGLGDILNSVENFVDNFANENNGTNLYIPVPTLAYYATSVEMYFQGEIYRGFFTNFSVTESAGKVGLFSYQMNFKATQRRGYRRNFMPWHHTALAGPSDHDTVPYTFNAKLMPSVVDPTNSFREEMRRASLEQAVNLLSE